MFEISGYVIVSAYARFLLDAIGIHRKRKERSPVEKQEFLDKLRGALTGEVSTRLVTDNVRYYEEYILTQSRMGKSEAEVIDELGDPRLIAHTIIDMNQTGDMDQHVYEETNTEDSHNDGWFRHLSNIRRIPKWTWIVIIILVLYIIFRLAFSLFILLLPVILPVAIIVGVVKLFRNWLK
jgi:uncharacterized membrane protein